MELYGKDIFFDIFVNAIFDKSSFNNISSFQVLQIFAEYFRQTCIEIKDELKILDTINKIGYYEEPYWKWSHFLKYDTNNDDQYRGIINDWLHFRKKYDENLFWLDYKKIKKENIDAKTIKFSKDDNYLLFKIDESSNRAVIIYDNEEEGWFTSRKEFNDFIIYGITYNDKDHYFKRLVHRLFYSINGFITQFGLSILKLSYYKYDYGSFDEEYRILDRDLKVLAKNQSLMNVLKQIKDNFDKYFKEFLTYNNEVKK